MLGAAVSQVAELCAAGGVPLSTVTNRDLAASLAAAEKVAPDKAAVSLIKSLATRAMSEAQYFSAGVSWHGSAVRPATYLTFAWPHHEEITITLLCGCFEHVHNMTPAQILRVSSRAGPTV